MNKVIILGSEVADVGREEALGMVHEVLTIPRTTPSPPWKGGDYHYITTPNPEIVLAARRDKELRTVINNSFLALPDGFGLKIAAWILGQRLEHRIAGADFMLDVCALTEKEGWPVFLLGGMDSHRTTPSPPWKGGDILAKQTAEKLRQLHPDIKVVGAESGGKIFYKGSLPPPFAKGGVETTGEWVASDKSVIDKINQSGAKILFVGFGCPKQEKWLRDNLKKLTTVKLAMTVGGTFDYLAGKAKRSPLALRRLGLEWMWRLVHEPHRLGRIWDATGGFMRQVIKWRWRMQFSYRRNVVGFIVNRDNQVLIVRRRPGSLIQGDDNNHWQLPQGGVEKNENDEQAVQREMGEEIGLTNLDVVARHPNKYKYEVPLLVKLHYGRRGQLQTIFYLRWSGDNDAVRLDEEELVDYRWVPITEAVELVHEVRRPMTQMAAGGYGKISNF